MCNVYIFSINSNYKYIYITLLFLHIFSQHNLISYDKYIISHIILHFRDNKDIIFVR